MQKPGGLSWIPPGGAKERRIRREKQWRKALKGEMDVILPRPDYFWQNIPFPPRRRVLRCCKELEVQHDPLLRNKR